MSEKGFVRWILIAIVAVCLFQFVFYVPTLKYERNADTYAAEKSAGITDENERYKAEKEARAQYLDSISSEKIFSIPMLKEYTYNDLKKQQLGLGLDLKGGMSSTLQIDLQDFVTVLAGKSADPAFKSAIAAAAERQKSSQLDFINLFAEEFKKAGNGKTLASIFSRSPTLKDRINIQTSDADVTRILRELANETVDLTFKRIKDRIDKFGVTQPNVSLDKKRDMITVELPGVDNPARARKYLQASAKLEFWELFRIDDPGVIDAFVNADKKLEALESGDTSIVEKKEYTLSNRYDYTKDSLGNNLDSTLAGVDTIRDVNLLGDRGPLMSLLSLNGGSTASYSPSVMGVVEKSNREKVLTMLNRPEIKSLFPSDMEFRIAAEPYSNYETKQVTNNYELYSIKQKVGSDGAALDGARIIRSDVSPDPVTGQVAVNLAMDNKGSKIWGEMTTRAANDNNRQIAIALDDEIVSSPRVINPILGGNTQISGNFTIDEAKDLSNILQVGKLPAKTRIVAESLVGPSLGKENISKSLWSILGGFFLVMLFMVLYYTGGGLFSILALLFNILFILATLASLGTVLTLPGIAGIVLTMGMAVDANVIIYERIKEELAAGRAKLDAIREGFINSYSAIIDSNVTTILTSIVLFVYGLGPIKGFAIVLIIGILFSMFTAVLVSRMLIEWWVAKGRDISFATPLTSRAFKGINYDWIGKRKFAYIFSGLLILISFISFFTRGFELGVEFKGGYSYNINFDKDVNIEELRGALDKSFASSTVVKSIDTRNTFNITTSYLINDISPDVQEKVSKKLYEGVSSVVGSDLKYEDFINNDAVGTHITTSSQIGPVIADDIKSSAVKSIIIALLVIFLYILFRFRRWQYSAGAVIALAHDTIITLGIFSLFHGVFNFAMEIDQAFIAAILTVIGYSINDTVIVFDRIKEYLGKETVKTEKELINDAINTTLSRTINTSLATILTIVILFFFGGSSTKGFSFALIVGIIVGTYSSIFVATPIVVDFAKDLKLRAKKITHRVSNKLVKTKSV